MVLLLLVLCGLLILAVAGYAVSRSSARLARTEGVSVFDLKRAVAWTAERLPEGVEVNEETISRLLLLQVDYLRSCGMATFGNVDQVAVAAAEDLGAVTLDEDDMVTAVLGLAWQEGLDVDEVDVVVVLDINNGYLRSIGAIGDQSS